MSSSAIIDRTQQPPRVMALLHTSLKSLQTAVGARSVRAAEQASVEVAQSAIDLEARYLPPQQVEVARFHLHTQQLRVAAAAGIDATENDRNRCERSAWRSVARAVRLAMA